VSVTLSVECFVDPPHVGYFVRAIIPQELTITQAAKLLKIGRPALSNVVNEKADLSISLAAKLQDRFYFKAETLLKYQVEYKLKIYRETIVSEIHPINPFPKLPTDSPDDAAHT